MPIAWQMMKLQAVYKIATVILVSMARNEMSRKTDYAFTQSVLVKVEFTLHGSIGTVPFSITMEQNSDPYLPPQLQFPGLRAPLLRPELLPEL